MSGWFGFDLDGTLAKYDGWVDELHIGEPIPSMVALVKYHLSKGREVRIVTARVSTNQGRANHTVDKIREAIQDWTEKHIGARLPVTCEKDYGMITLYDDRVKQVVPNEGILVEDQYISLLSKVLQGSK